MHIYECTNKGTQTQGKKTYYNTRYKRKVIIIIIWGKKTRLYSPYICAIYIRT